MDSQGVDAERDRFGFVLPEPDETDSANADRIMRSQRNAWVEFITERNNRYDEAWLWQYWREESRPSKVKKGLMSMFSSKLALQKRIKTLIRQGVPEELRAKVWWACSGAQQKKEAVGVDQQFGVLSQRVHELEGSQFSLDIEKDMNRTYPNSTLMNTPQTLASLRKILYAYAIRNPAIGYCQSMNFVACVLLLYLTEEQAFWVFCALVEDIIPQDYYSPSMIGSRIDQMVFESVVAWKIPTLHRHFKDIGMLLEPVTCPWMLCLFTTALPMEYVCRVWDCLLWEGPVVLFRVGLVMLKMKTEELLACDEFVEVYSALRSPRSAAYDVHSISSIKQRKDFYISTADTIAAHGAGDDGTSPQHSPLSGVTDCTNRETNSAGFMGARKLSTTLRNSIVSTLTLGNVPPVAVPTGKKQRFTLSRLDSFMYLAFDKRWIKSVPRDVINRLRSKFRRLLEEQNRAKMAKGMGHSVAFSVKKSDSGKISLPAGIAKSSVFGGATASASASPGARGATTASGQDEGENRPTVHSMLLHSAMEDLMSPESAMHEVVHLYKDVNQGSNMIWAIESSVVEEFASKKGSSSSSEAEGGGGFTFDRDDELDDGGSSSDEYGEDDDDDDSTTNSSAKSLTPTTSGKGSK